jgi:hypothetical protein
MKTSALLISTVTVALVFAAAYALSGTPPERVSEPAKAAFSTASNIESFEFLGCSGDWTDEKIEPQVWRAGQKGKTTFLTKHPADCGYTTGNSPKAVVSGSALELSYTLSNDDGVFAACYCEYWAAFELKSALGSVSKIKVNGRDAQLMSGLSERQ